jgi:hypothetical protein
LVKEVRPLPLIKSRPFYGPALFSKRYRVLVMDRLGTIFLILNVKKDIVSKE